MPFEVALGRGRTSVGVRVDRWRAKRWAIAQCSIAAGVAWWFAHEVVGHACRSSRRWWRWCSSRYVLRPAAAPRRRGHGRCGHRGVRCGPAGAADRDGRVADHGDRRAWRCHGDAAPRRGQVFVTQAAVQAIVVVALLPRPTRPSRAGTDALIGGAVALSRRRRRPTAPFDDHASRPPRRTPDRDAPPGSSGECARRATSIAACRCSPRPAAPTSLIRELQDAADEGLSVVASSPFRSGRPRAVRRMVDLVEPLDRAMRSTRVLVGDAVAVELRHPSRIPRRC